MRAFTAVLLTLATIANAVPSGSKLVDTRDLQARKKCVYECVCSEGGTEQCCFRVGGKYDGSQYCKSMNIPTYNDFKGCCAEGAVVCMAPIGCPA